jgi:uncharacterized membrane protein YgcG
MMEKKMHLFKLFRNRGLSLIALLFLLITPAFSQQQNGSLSGQVADEVGAVIVGATVVLIDADGKEKTTVTDKNGNYVFNGLNPGTYSIRATANGFGVFQTEGIEIAAGKRLELPLMLTVALKEEKVDVNPDNELSTDPNANGSATVLKKEELESLPDDPDELAAALLALAGPSAGPNGGQIFVDGFPGGRMPPKEAIREVRINQNPFSAEFDRLGFGRVEILTRPGFDRFRGGGNFNFNDESLNTRNPYARTKAATQNRNYGFNLGGPIKKNKMSFFLDFNRREGDDNALVNATVLDAALNPVSFNQTVLVPTRSLSFSPRFDYAINTNNTLVGRYSYSRRSTDNRGVGDFSLPSLGYETSGTDQMVQLTETSILTGSIVNETRFQYTRSRDQREGNNTLPILSVSQSFNTGGAQVGNSYTNTDTWEVTNITTWLYKTHTFKFGSRLRNVRIEDRSESNFAGSVSFFGSLGLNSLEQYKQRLLGNTAARFLPSQFSISIGNPLTNVKQYEFGGFFTDDWRVRPNLTVSFGLRYENQSNIESNLNFAPRFSFAWTPGGGGNRQPKMVIRGGGGIFYNRIGENTSMQTIRFDGQRQLQYLIRNNPAVEDTAANNLLRQIQFGPNGSVSNLPTAAQLASFTATTNVVRVLQIGAQAPYTMQTAISLERQLPLRITATVNYVFARSLHLLRQRNINAPVITGYNANGTPILQFKGNPIYEYDTSGKSTQNFLSINVNSRFSPKFTLFGNYTLGKINSDTDGGFPEYSYDLTKEYGRASFDIRHRVFISGSITLPWNISLNPFLLASTGRPFNITTGQDINGDLQINERPTFAQLAARCATLGLTNSFCDTSNVADPNAVIPRNYGQGPSSFTLNLRVSKTFGFGNVGDRNVANSQQSNQQAGNQQGSQGGGGPRGGGGGGLRGGNVFGGGGMGGMFGGGGNTEKRYNLTFTVNFNNLLNRNNKGNPIGNMSSPSFGQSLSGGGGFGGFGGGGVFFGGGGGNAGNRRIELGIRFNF